MSEPTGASIFERATLAESGEADRQAAERELCLMLAPRLRLIWFERQTRHVTEETSVGRTSANESAGTAALIILAVGAVAGSVVLVMMMGMR